MERAELLRRMAIAVDEILNAEERPSWLHPLIFHGPLTSAICSLPPIPDNKAILAPPTADPREVYWSKFSICNHSRPLEKKPFIVSLQYHSPYPLETSQNGLMLSPSGSGITSQPFFTSSIDNGSTVSTKKCTLPCVGALPNNKFRDV
uniref:DUF4708 domain-containing protein n=1 Tax=Elaeophora elaphi TaxID=1147741 RepID=A0A0R3S4P6_9BILA